MLHLHQNLEYTYVIKRYKSNFCSILTFRSTLSRNFTRNMKKNASEIAKKSTQLAKNQIQKDSTQAENVIQQAGENVNNRYAGGMPILRGSSLSTPKPCPNNMTNLSCNSLSRSPSPEKTLTEKIKENYGMPKKPTQEKIQDITEPITRPITKDPNNISTVLTDLCITPQVEQFLERTNGIITPGVRAAQRKASGNMGDTTITNLQRPLNKSILAAKNNNEKSLSWLDGFNQHKPNDTRAIVSNNVSIESWQIQETLSISQNNAISSSTKEISPIIVKSLADQVNNIEKLLANGEELPSSPVKPPGMTDEQYLHFCLLISLKTARDCGMSAREALICTHFLFGNPGKNINTINNIAKKISWFYPHANFTEIFSEQELANMDRETLQSLEKLSYKKATMKAYERKSIAQVNRPFIEHEILFNDERTPAISDANCSPNHHPDARLPLEPAIYEYKNKYFDVKLHQGTKYRQHDIIQISTNLRTTALAAHNNLYAQAEFFLNANLLSDTDIKSLADLLQDLDNNRDTYIKTGNIWQFSIGFNALHEKHVVILTTLRMGMNLQSTLTCENMNVQETAKKLYQETFLYTYMDPQSNVQQYLNTKSYNQNTTDLEHEKNLIEFANQLL